MTEPDDPYASPPRELEQQGTRDRSGAAAPPVQHPWGQPPGQPQWGQPQWAAPVGPAVGGPPPGAAAGAGGLGAAALVAGVLALVLGVTMVGGVLLGALAVLLGTRGRQRARLRGGRSGTATAGVVLGLLGVVVAAATYAYVRDDLSEFRDCRRASVSLAQDRACEQQLRATIERR